MYASIHTPDFPSSHAALLDCASAFSPRVEDTSENTVVLDIDGLERLFGSAAAIAEQLNRQLKNLGLTANIAIAVNPDAAVCASRGFPGITILETSSEAKRLKPLGIDLLPIDNETFDTLHRWGIRTFGDLARLPVKSLSARLGQHGVHLHRLARGCALRPLQPHMPPLQFEESIDLDDAIVLLEPLTFVINRLTDTLFHRLKFRGLAALEMHLQLKRERPHEPFVLSLQLPMPAQNPRIVTRLFALELDAHPPGAPVIGIRLEAIPAKPRVIQNGLFVPLYPEPEKLELTMARIAAIVGRNNIGSPELQDTHARDRFFMTRMKYWKNFKTPGKPGMPEPHSRTTIALRLLRPAPEATIRLQQGVPVWLAFELAHGPVETASGPWTNSGDWWNPQAWAREEWDVALKSMVLRVYQNMATGRWYAEGIYD
jgi:protein ImuB